MNHGADSFCKTNASRRPEFIKSESEPLFHAETHSADNETSHYYLYEA